MMKKKLVRWSAYAALLAAWCIHRNEKYPIDKPYRIMNKLFVPGFMFQPKALTLINDLRGKQKLPPLPGIQKTELTFDTHYDDPRRVTLFETLGDQGIKPALVYIHGGGFGMAEVAVYEKYMAQFAKEVRCKVFFVHYRTSDKYAFPIPFEDCYDSLRFIYKNAERLQIDTARLAVGGDSAGGALAAAVAQKARDTGEIPLCYQMLIYPVTDYTLETPSSKCYTDSPVWNSSLSKQMWALYLRDGDKGQLAYASPMHATTFEALPPAYVEVQEFDSLHDEGVNYANALKVAGVPVKLAEVKGTFHGYDLIFPKSKKARYMMQARCSYLKDALHPPL